MFCHENIVPLNMYLAFYTIDVLCKTSININFLYINIDSNICFVSLDESKM